MSSARHQVSANEIGNIIALVGEASESERAGGLGWYPAFSAAVTAYGAEHGWAGPESLAIFAALSPMTGIERNWSNFQHAATDRDLSRCVGVTGNQRRKLAAFLSGGSSLEAVTAGRKVSAFYANLRGDLHGVTIDRHAAAAALGYCPKAGKVSPGAYKRLALAYQAAAAILDLEPAQVQAIVWIVWRRKKGIHDHGGLRLVA